MPRFMVFQVQGRPGFRGWLAIMLSLALLAAVVVGLVILAIGFLVFVLPVLLISGLISYFVLRSKLKRAMRQRPSASGTIIEGDYTVVDSDQKSFPDRVPPE